MKSNKPITNPYRTMSEWSKLLYEKFIGDNTKNGDHHYGNKITSAISIEDLEDGSYEYIAGRQAIEFYNQKFKGTFSLPDFLLDSNT